jgi:hypothetical protein
MNYLTNYYKNLCEQLQDKVNHLEKLMEDLTTDESEMDFIRQGSAQHREMVGILRPIADALGGHLEAHDTVVRAVVTGDFDAIPKEHHKALKKARGMNEKLQTLNRDQEARRADRTTIYGAKQKVVGTTGKDETRGLGEISLLAQDQEGRYKVNPNATYSRDRALIFNPDPMQQQTAKPARAQP